MFDSIIGSNLLAGQGTLRFVPGRLSNGHFGVFDTALEIYVLRDVAHAFAEAVATRLNSPAAWEPGGVQAVADAIRQSLKTPRADLAHVH